VSVFPRASARSSSLLPEALPPAALCRQLLGRIVDGEHLAEREERRAADEEGDRAGADCKSESERAVSRPAAEEREQR